MNLIDISFIERGYAEVLKRNDKNWHSGRPQMYMWEKCGGDSRCYSLDDEGRNKIYYVREGDVESFVLHTVDDNGNVAHFNIRSMFVQFELSDGDVLYTQDKEISNLNGAVICESAGFSIWLANGVILRFPVESIKDSSPEVSVDELIDVCGQRLLMGASTMIENMLVRLNPRSPENEDDIYRLKKANDLILEVRREQTACYL